MASNEAAALLSNEFVTVKLDSDRGVGAKEIEQRFINNQRSLPWFAFLDADGNCLIHSVRPSGGNIGHPTKPEELGYFKNMLNAVRKNLTAEEIDRLIQSLERFNKSAGIA